MLEQSSFDSAPPDGGTPTETLDTSAPATPVPTPEPASPIGAELPGSSIPGEVPAPPAEPLDVGGYDLQGFEPPADIVDREALGQMGGVMRRLGLADDQVRELVSAYFELRGEQREASGQQQDAAGEPPSSYTYDLRHLTDLDPSLVDEAGMEVVSGIFSKAGLSQQQAQAVVSGYLAEVTRGMAEAASPEAARNELRREWGGSTEARVASAAKAFRATFGAEADELLNTRLEDGSYLGNNPTMVRAFARLAEQLPRNFAAAPSNQPTPRPQTPDTRLTPASSAPADRASIMRQVEALEAHPGFYQKHHRDHDEIVRQRGDLLSRLT